MSYLLNRLGAQCPLVISPLLSNLYLNEVDKMRKFDVGVFTQPRPEPDVTAVASKG
jgi:hypothetical protein